MTFKKRFSQINLDVLGGMEGQSGQKEPLLILINDFLILINDFLILINHFLILINIY